MSEISRELLILRHAKSAWDTDAETDFDRPLAKRGRKDAPRIGAWLRKEGLIPDYVVASPAKRARQTVERVCAALGIAEDKIHWDQRIYEAGTATLVEVLADCPRKARRVLLVGHNPGLEALLVYLCAEIPVPADGKLLPTAAVARVRMPADWQGLRTGAAQLLSLTRPKAL